MAAIATLDLTAARPDGKTRKVRMQTDAPETIRLVLLPSQDRYKLTVGPLQESTGLLSSGRLSYAFGAAADTYTNNASGTAVADGAIRGDIQAGEAREFTTPLVAAQRPLSLALWTDDATSYVELTLDAVE